MSFCHATSLLNIYNNEKLIHIHKFGIIYESNIHSAVNTGEWYPPSPEKNLPFINKVFDFLAEAGEKETN